MGDTGTTMPCIDTTIVRDGPCPSLNHQQEMHGTFTGKETLRVIKDLSNDKALRIDGCTEELFKEYLETVGEEIVNDVLQFFDNAKLLRKVNCTTITLVNLIYAKDFIHIAYCTTIYKIIASLLTAKLKTMVDYLVGSSQYPFIE